jgi:hypothetical protein
MTMPRREFLAGILAATCLLVPAVRTAAASARRMEIYKDPLCGCCESWAAAMKAAGFAVDIHNEGDMTAVKSRFAIPAEMEACHTAVLDGYVIEGHVPIEAIRKLLAERPDIAGIAVPGMPAGSLGMGDDPEAAYEVYAIANQAGVAPTVFYSVRPV